VASGPSPGNGLVAAGDGRYEQNAVAFLEGAGFAAQEANVFFVEINVEELADLAVFVTNVSRDIGKARGQFVQSSGDGGCTTVDLWRAVGEATEGSGDFDGDGHFSYLLVLFDCKLSFCARRSGAELRIEVGLEGFQAWGDGFGGWEFGDDSVGGLQTVPGDAHDSGFVGLDAILGD